jgi:hypothetical protein
MSKTSEKWARVGEREVCGTHWHVDSVVSPSRVSDHLELSENPDETDQVVNTRRTIP